MNWWLDEMRKVEGAMPPDDRYWTRYKEELRSKFPKSVRVDLAKLDWWILAIWALLFTLAIVFLLKNVSFDGSPAVRMATRNWLLIVAVLLSPIVALRVSRALDRRQERRRRLLDAFHTLLATRAEKATPQHAKAFNTIRLDFHARRLFGPLLYHCAADAKVLESCHVYRQHLHTPPNGAAGAAHTSDIIAWQRRVDELLSDLLYDLARTLGYSFDRGFLDRAMYTPYPMTTPSVPPNLTTPASDEFTPRAAKDEKKKKRERKNKPGGLPRFSSRPPQSE